MKRQQDSTKRKAGKKGKREKLPFRNLFFFQSSAVDPFEDDDLDSEEEEAAKREALFAESHPFAAAIPSLAAAFALSALSEKSEEEEEAAAEG